MPFRNSLKFKALLIAACLLTAGLWVTLTDSKKIEISNEQTPGPGMVQTSPLSRQKVPNSLEDPSGLYTLVLPEDWKVVLTERNKGVQLSFVTAESSDYRERRDETADGPFTPIYFESGAKLTIHVTKDEENTTRDDPGTIITAERSITVDGVQGIFHIHKEPSIREGQLLHAHFASEGNNYLFDI